MREALEKIRRICHVPTPHGMKAYTHFGRDFDQIRKLCDNALSAKWEPDQRTVEECAKIAQTYQRKVIGRNYSDAVLDPCGRWVGGEIYDAPDLRTGIVNAIRSLLKN